MNIQIYQLLLLFIYGALAAIVLYCKNTKIIVTAIAVAAILFFVNPIRFKQDNAEVLERSVSRFADVPAKVTVKEETFNETLNRELKSLKQQSEDRKDEIHN